MKQNVIAIAGAHRSGTSMLTRLLHQCGLYLGPEVDLMPAASDNPDGFWEHLRFVALNDDILNAVGAAWDLPPWETEDFQSEPLQSLRFRAQLLIDRFRDQPSWGWKDPRTCLTMRFWTSLMPTLKTVIIVRNPLEAAYSMNKRNGVSYALGLRLWEIYNRRLLATTEPGARIISHYQSFFEHPQAELEKIVRFIGLTNVELSEAVALVSTNRRHTHFSLEQMIDAGVATSTIDLYRQLLEDEIGSITTEGKPSGDRLTGARSKLNLSVAKAEEVRQELAIRRGNEIQQREEIGRHKAVIEDLRRELAAKSVSAAAEINRRDGRIEELQKAYAHIDELLLREQGQRNQLLAELQNESRRTQELRERFVQTNQLLKQTSVRLSDFESRYAQLRDRLRKVLMEMKRLMRLMDQVDDAADRLRRSRRWKMANPFAALVAAFSRRPLAGFGHLDRNLEKYRAWRKTFAETKELEQEIQDLRPREILSPPPESQSPPAASTPVQVIVSPSSIKFPESAQPDVSIIIPVYNQSKFTLACLDSVQQHTGDVNYEVIVVDDYSIDDTEPLMRQITGLRYLRSEENAGFTVSCNRGAQAAKGRYLVFLNNDTTVTDGWLTSLLDTYAFEPKAGLVGSKLVYPDGKLQEAGGIIWRDGSGWNRGKYQDPNLPEFNFLREVDYCSAASVIIPKSLFEEVGRFDEKYSPAYYEDTDLAFKVAKAERKVLYQPLSTVIHHEGATAGTDITTGTKQYQETNRTTFVSTWADRLSTQPVNGDIAAWEAPAEGCQRILVIDHHLPLLDRDSGSLRMYQILSILARQGHRVTFIPDNLADIPPYGDHLRRAGIRVLHHPYCSSIVQYLQSHGNEFDTVILSRCDFARKHIGSVRQFAPQSRLIFDTVDLHFLRQEREADLAQSQELTNQAAEKRALEFSLIDQADQTWVVSPVEQQLLQRERPHKSIEIVSNIVDVPGSVTPFALRRDLLFIGSFLHPPNADAVIYFARDIFPLITPQLPGIKFYVIGGNLPPEVIALASEQIILTGLQANVQAYFDTVRLSVAPLRFGAGVKGKINQSMGFGVPVVATSIAAEGMSLTHRIDAMIADEPEAFAEAVVTLNNSEPLWDELSRNALSKTRALFSKESARQQLTRLFGKQYAHESRNGSD
jgi:GT2 family glycosyltransferase/glycosyltransferase involved in cell wall biosynthesis